MSIFENIGHSAAFTASPRSFFTGRWDGGTIIEFDPNPTQVPILSSAEFVHVGTGRPVNVLVDPTNILAHELVHVWQYNSRFDSPPKIDGIAIAPGNSLEEQAVRYTNRVRRERGFTYIRTIY